MADFEKLSNIYDSERINAENEARKKQSVSAILENAAYGPKPTPTYDVGPSPAELAYRMQMQQAQQKQAAYNAVGVSDRELAIANRLNVDPFLVAGRRKTISGRAAYDPNKEIEQQVAVPVSMQRSVSNANKYTEDELNKYEKLSIESAENQLEKQRQQISAQETIALNRALVDDIYASDEAKELGKKEIERQEGYDKITKEIEDIASTKTDQARLFKDRGALSTILSSVGSLLQKYGAAQVGQYGIKTMFDNEIANDIASQEREIRMKGDAAKGKLADFTRRFDGDIERGKLALKTAQQQALASKMENMETAARSQLTKAALAENKSLLYKEIQANMMELHAANRGTISETTNMQMRTPQAGYSGGVTYDLQGLSSDVMAQKENNQKLMMELGDEKNDLYQKAASDMAELDEAQATINRTMKLLGATRDPVTGEWVAPEDAPPGMGFIGRKLPNIIKSSEGMRNSQNVEAITAAAVKQLAGPGTIQESERDLYTPVIQGDGSIEGFVNGINAAESSSKAKQDALIAKYGQETIDKYNKNKEAARLTALKRRIAVDLEKE